MVEPAPGPGAPELRSLRLRASPAAKAQGLDATEKGAVQLLEQMAGEAPVACRFDPLRVAVDDRVEPVAPACRGPGVGVLVGPRHAGDEVTALDPGGDAGGAADYVVAQLDRQGAGSGEPPRQLHQRQGERERRLDVER